MKKAAILMFLGLTLMLNGQEQDKPQIYHPEDNARKKIDSVVHVAKQENKFVLLEIGGNWCYWCVRFNKVTEENADIKKVLNDYFVVYHLNYSKENKNKDILEQLDFPQRFGFPVFVILNEKGKRIHTQQSDFLENESVSYDVKKVLTFLQQWSPPALNPENYKEDK